MQFQTCLCVTLDIVRVRFCLIALFRMHYFVHWCICKCLSVCFLLLSTRLLFEHVSGRCFRTFFSTETRVNYDHKTPSVKLRCRSPYFMVHFFFFEPNSNQPHLSLNSHRIHARFCFMELDSHSENWIQILKPRFRF